MAVASTDICLTRLDEEVKKGQAIPAAARWFVEQQSSELPFCQPQQERAGQRQRQYRVSGRVRSPVKCSSVRELTNRNSFVGSVKEEFRPVPVVLVTASENQIGLGSLVGVKAEELPNFSSIKIFKIEDDYSLPGTKLLVLSLGVLGVLAVFY